MQYRKPVKRSEYLIDRRDESTPWSVKAGRAQMAANAAAKYKSLPGAGSDFRVTKAMRQAEQLARQEELANLTRMRRR